jgi:hypothetical protein
MRVRVFPFSPPNSGTSLDKKGRPGWAPFSFC